MPSALAVLISDLFGLAGHSLLGCGANGGSFGSGLVLHAAL